MNSRGLGYYISSSNDTKTVEVLEKKYGDFSTVTKAKKLKLIVFLLSHFEVVRTILKFQPIMVPLMRDPLFMIAAELSDRSKLQFCIALIEQILEAR